MARPAVAAVAHDEVVRFLRARLSEELALLWDRDLARPDGWTGPGLAAQVEAVDGVLRQLDSGRLPSRVETHLLLHAYRTHPDHDPAWTTSG